MSNEEKFKQSLKSLVESKEFVFDETDWDKAGAYIEKRRGMNRAMRIAALLLFISGVVTTAFFVLPSPAAEKEQIRTELIRERDKSAPVTESPVTTPVERKTVESKPSAPVQKKHNVAAEKFNPMKRMATNSAVPPTADKFPDKTDQPGAIDVTFSKREQNSKAVTLETEIPPGIANVEEPTRENTIADQQAMNAEEAPDQKPFEENTTEVSQETVTVSTESITTAAAVNQTTQIPDSIKAKIPRVMLLSCEAGASYLAGWKNDGSARDAQGLNPVVGFHYMTAVDSRFTLSFGIQYQRTGHLGAYSHTSKQSRYSFGEESQVTTITPTTLHYLALPLRVYYKLDEKNTIGGAYSIGYLLDVEADVTSYSVKAGAATNKTSYSTRGFTDGFALFDSQVSVFYRRHLYGPFSLQGEVFYGLSDVKQNNFFGGNSSQRNTGLRLMLVYGIHSSNK